GLWKNEVEKMVAGGRSHEAEDKERREIVEVKNRAENLQYQMEKLVKENRDKISPDTVSSLEAALKQLESVRSGNDKAAIESAMSALEQVSHKAAEEMYRAAGAQGGQPGAPGSNPDAPGSQATPKKDDVVDAEFRTNEAGQPRRRQTAGGPLRFTCRFRFDARTGAAMTPGNGAGGGTSSCWSRRG